MKSESRRRFVDILIDFLLRLKEFYKWFFKVCRRSLTFCRHLLRFCRRLMTFYVLSVFLSTFCRKCDTFCRRFVDVSVDGLSSSFVDRLSTICHFCSQILTVCRLFVDVLLIFIICTLFWSFITIVFTLIISTYVASAAIFSGFAFFFRITHFFLISIVTNTESFGTISSLSMDC